MVFSSSSLPLPPTASATLLIHTFSSLRSHWGIESDSLSSNVNGCNTEKDLSVVVFLDVLELYGK